MSEKRPRAPRDPSPPPDPGAHLFDELTSLGTTTRYARHDTILKEGETTDSLVAIVRGQVRVLSTAEDGRLVVIDEHGPGQYVGELALDGNPRSATVMALTDCEVSIVPKSAVLEFIRRRPDFALDLILKLVHRTRLATENFKGLAFLNVYGRIVRLLTGLAHPVDGLLQVDELPTQTDIAQRVGASREMVSIIMRDLAEGGYIERNGRQLTIRKHLPQRW